MSSSTGDLLTLLGGHDPVGVVFYRDDVRREALLELCELLATEERPLLRTTTVDDVFRPEYRDSVLLIVVLDEIGTVRTLEGRREELLSREAPAVLFLMQRGSAEDVLNREAPALSSFLRGLTYDPEPPANEQDLLERRARFEQEHGRSPDEWLQAWRRDELDDTAENNLTAHEARGLRAT